VLAGDREKVGKVAAEPHGTPVRPTH